MAEREPGTEVKEAEATAKKESESGGLPDADDPQQLEAWLRQQPPEVAAIIAARGALRILPLIVLELQRGKRTIEELGPALFLPIFRATSVPWAAGTWPAQGAELAARAARAADAAGAARTAADAAYAAVEAVRAAHAAYAAAHAATDAARAARAARAAHAAQAVHAAYTVRTVRAADAAHALEADIQAILRGAGGIELNISPLWPDDDIPEPLGSIWDRLKEALLSLDEGWEVWTDWYEARLEGRPANEALEVARATIPDEVWQQGPKVVNAHIRELIARYHGGSISEPAAATADNSSVAAGVPPRPTVWLAQFKQDRDRVSRWVRAAGPGSTVPWKIGNADVSAMRPGDPVVYWRTIGKGRDRGGVIGTGRIVSATPQPDDTGEPRVATEIVEFHPDEPLGRDAVIEATGLDPGHWRFSLYELPAEVAERMEAYLRQNGRGPFPPVPPPQSRRPASGAGEIVFIGDAPVRDKDYLGRGELAFVLAGRLSQVWDELNDGAEEEAAYDAGFVVHIDAPWGGGKTTFANHLGCILNAYRGEPPGWLTDLVRDETRQGRERYASWPQAFRRPWHLVTFNAWQHQHVEPPWWCFYQAIRKQTFHAVRTEEWDLSEHPLPLPSAGWPGIWENRHARWLWLWAKELAWRLFTPKNMVLLAIAIPTLAVAKYGYDNDWFSVEGRPVEFAAAVAALLTGSLSFVWAVFSTLTASLVPGTPDAARNYSLGSGDPLERFRRHFARTMQALERPVLVVVDDIDRCKPGFVVELVRGMQTILKSPRIVFLVLGDRDWIEHAFAETHKAMKGIPVGPEHSFGGRFVEKAIQLSLVLPDIPAAHRTGYVRRLLGVAEEAAGADPVQALPEEQRTAVEESLEQVVQEADPLERERGGASVRSMVSGFNLAPELTKAVSQSVNRKLTLRSAADEKVREATQHQLVPIARVLPPNPRQIKRIINAISLFQEMGRSRIEYPSEESWFETQRWRQLALWIVLMTEWPQTWTILAAWPDLVTRVHKPEDGTAIAGLDEATADAWAAGIRANDDVMKLLDFPRYGGEEGKVPQAWRDAKIDADAVRALTAIMPPVSAPPPPPEAEDQKGDGEDEPS